MRSGQALLPADLLVQFEPWRSQVSAAPRAHWDPLVWDGIAQYYPWRAFAADSLRAGHLPLWNPYQFCGTPFLANGQSAVLYPPNLLFWILPVARAFAWSAWLHLALTGWFMYLLVRALGVGRFGALAGAVVWQANSFFVAWIHLPTVLCTASWLPLVLLCCERALVTGRTRHAAAAGLALGLSYLGGHPHIFLYVGLLTAVYIILRGLSRGLGVPFPGRLRRLARVAVVMGSTAAGLSAAQLLPTLELLRVAHRTFVPGPDSYAAFLSHAMPAAQIFGLALPHAFGHPALGTYAGLDNFAELSAYVGIVALALAVWGAFSSRTWHGRFFAGALALAGLVALGTQVNWPMYHWIPGVARGGGPTRILLLAVFSLSVLAGVGADTVVRRLTLGRRLSLGPIIAVLAVLLGAAWFWWWRGIPMLAEVKSGVSALARAEVVRATILVAAAVACLLFVRRQSLRRIGQVGLLAILAVDLVLAAQQHVHTAPLEWVYPSGAAAGSGTGRIIGNAHDWPIDRFPRAVLPPNAATVYRMRDAFGYDSLYLARYRDFAAAIQHGDPSPPLNGNLLLARLAPTYGLDMMSLAGVETVLSPVPLKWLRMERVGAFYTYRNPYAMPRAWIAQSAVFRPTHREAVVALAQLGVLEDCLLITGPDEPLEEFRPERPPTAEAVDLSPNAVAVRLPEGGGGYLFLADSFAPGWRAYAGERELSIRAAYVTFRAVAPPRDARTVIFRYEPASFRVGLFIVLTTLAGVCAAGMLLVAVRVRPE